MSDSEDLLRIVISPRHVDRKRGLPKAAALTHAEGKGMSCFRSAHAADAEIYQAAEGLVKSARSSDPLAGVFGVLTMKASELKLIDPQFDVSAPYCIYDLPMENQPAHADVYQRTHGVRDEIKQARRQALFGRVAKCFVGVVDFRNGLLVPLRPG